MSLLTNPPRYNRSLNYTLIFFSVLLRISSIVITFFYLISFYYDSSHHTSLSNEECQLLTSTLQATTFLVLFTNIITGSPIDLFFAHYRHESHKALDVFLNTMCALFGTVWAVNEHKCDYLFSENLRLKDHWVFLYLQLIHIMPVYIFVALLILTNLARFPFDPMSFHLMPIHDGLSTTLTSSPRSMPPLPKLRMFSTTSPPDCAICFEPVLNNTLIRDIPCEHIYHQKCLDTWLEMNSRNGCPTCRINVRVDPSNIC